MLMSYVGHKNREDDFFEMQNCYVLLVGNHLFMLNLEDPYVTNQNCS